MPILKDGAVTEDRFTVVADDASLPEGAVLVSLARLQNDADALSGREVGVALDSGVEPEVLKPFLAQLALVALPFRLVKDGRAYSYARLLRERYGFKGEVRATGEVKRDQMLYMHRCGFDAFEVADAGAAEQLKAALAEFSGYYQPGVGASREGDRLHYR